MTRSVSASHRGPTDGNDSRTWVRVLSTILIENLEKTERHCDMTTVANGVNVQALLEARDALKGAPEAAQFTWRSSAKWQGGVHSTMEVQSFFGLGEEQSHKQGWAFEADHPEVFAAEDNGITPIEYLLVGLASCLTAGVASVAQNRGIQLRSVEATVEAPVPKGPDSPLRRGQSANTGSKVPAPNSSAVRAPSLNPGSITDGEVEHPSSGTQWRRQKEARMPGPQLMWDDQRVL